MQQKEVKSNSDLVAAGASVLALVETGVGSWMHGFKLPLAGHILSLNQGFLLARVSLDGRELPGSLFLASHVSSVAAVLKSLSFAGKRLTPMLAISVQGGLFNLGTLIFGVNPIGLGVGMTLLCAWSYLQPLLLYYFSYGSHLLPLGEFYLNKFTETFSIPPATVLGIILALVMLKFLIGWALVVFAYRMPLSKFETWLNPIRSQLPIAATESGPKSSILASLKDVVRPLFLFSLILNAVFVYSLSLPTNQMLIQTLRPLAIGLICFYLLRSGILLRFLRRIMMKSRFTREAYLKTIALLQ